MPNAESRIDWHGIRTFATCALLVLFLGTVVALLLNWLRLSFDLDPTTPNPNLPQAHADWIAVLWVIAVVPVIGLLLRGGPPRVIWGLLLTAGLMMNLAAMAYRAHQAQLHPDPVPVVTQCQERSGGDTRCPGG
jgi:hypothetical protein